MSNYRNDDEIDLREYLRVIKKQKILIIGIVFIGLILTAITISIMPKTYEVKALVQRGYFNNPIMNYSETVVLLKSHDFLKPIFAKLNINSEDNVMKKGILLEDIENTNFFIIKVRCKDNTLGYLLIQEIISAYIGYGNSIYYAQLDFTKNHINEIESLTEKTQTNLERGQKINLEQKNISFPISIPDDKVQMRDLLLQKFQLESQLLVAKEFKLIDSPVKREYPVSPRKGLIIIIFCISTLIISMYFAFLIENWGKIKSNN